MVELESTLLASSEDRWLPRELQMHSAAPFIAEAAVVGFPIRPYRTGEGEDIKVPQPPPAFAEALLASGTAEDCGSVGACSKRA